MAWTAFPTWVVGQVSTASDWNTYVAANMNFLATPPLLRAWRSTAYTTGTSGATLLPINFVGTDSVSGFNTSTSLYTCQVAGSYLVTGGLSIGGATAADNYELYIYENGGVYSQGNGTGWAAGNGQLNLTATDIVTGAVAGTTTIALWYLTQTAQAVNVSSATNFLSIVKVSN